MSRWVRLLTGGLVVAAIVTCGCLGSVVLFHSAIPALSRWEAPYGIEGREPPSESVTKENVLREEVGEYRLREVVEPLSPMVLDTAGPSKQGSYSDGVQVVHLMAVQMKSPEEAQSLVARVDEEVEGAGAKGLERSWRPFAKPRGAWKMSRLAWDKWYVRFRIPTWESQAYGVACNNGPWFFMATGGAKSAIEHFVGELDY